MAVNGVDNTLINIGSIFHNQHTDLLLFSPPTTVLPENLNISQTDEILLKAQALLSETLQNLATDRQSELLLNETLSNLTFNQQVALLSESRLLLTEALQNLGSGPRSSLLVGAESLINTTLQNLNSSRQAELISQTEIQLNEALQGLTPNQQATVLLQAEASINESIQSLGPVSPVPLFNEEIFPPLEPVNATDEVLSPLQQEQIISGALPLEDSQRTGIQSQNLIGVTVGPTNTEPTTTTESPQVEEVIPVLPFQPLDPTTYGIAVYEVNRQKLTTLEPEPSSKTVMPTQPVAKTGLIDILLFRPKWEKKKESGRPLYVRPDQLNEQEIIRKIISRFNENQVYNNQPVHLVLAESDKGLALDIYDCSDNNVCQLVYDTPLASSEIPILLGNLRHQTGFFVNTDI